MRPGQRPAAFQWTPVLIAVLLPFGAARPSAAATVQEQAELVDRIVAVVGDSAVLQSELKEFVFRIQTQGIQVPQCVLAWATGEIRIPLDCPEFDEFIGQLLDQKIDEVLIVLHAQRAGITVSETDINEIVDQRLAAIKRGFQSELQFVQALQGAGLTAAEYRIQLAEQTRAELMTQRFLQQQVSQLLPKPVSEDEIRERFELQKNSLGPKPARVSLKQVIFGAGPSEDSRLHAQETAEKALSRARAGEDFALLAREYSDDPATAERGGELGWVRKGDMVPAFEGALWKLQAGEISELVQTTFGFHIVKLDRIRGEERFARHILVRPELTAEDETQAASLAQELAVALRAGADPDSLIQAHGDPQEQSTLTNFPQDQLPDEYQQALVGANPGDTLDPIKVTLGLPGGKWAVIRVTAISPGGEWTLDDVRESVRAQLEQEKLLGTLIDELRKSTLIEVRFESPVAG